MKGLKGSSDEGGCRVPFFVRWKGRIAPGRDIDRIAAHIDVTPTLAALVGADLPEGQVSGRDLLPLLENPSVDWEDRYLFTHQGRWKTGVDPDQDQWKNFAVRTQKYRFVANTALFDMEQDPSQENNIIDDHPELVRQMRAEYDAWWQVTRPMMVNESAPMSPVRPFHVLYEQQSQNGGIPEWKPPEL